MCSQFQSSVSKRDIRPTEEAPVVLFDPVAATVLGTAAVPVDLNLKWGLIPHWAKDPSIGRQLFNARVETLAEKPSFRKPLKSSRCVVPAQAYYEWRSVPDADPKSRKVRLRVAQESGRPFLFAGLHDAWTAPDGKVIRSFTIVTTQAFPAIRPIHDRMPLLIEPEDEAAWLDPTSSDKVVSRLLNPFPKGGIEALPCPSPAAAIVRKHSNKAQLS